MTEATVPQDGVFPSPTIHPGAWVAESAVVMGDVRIAASASLWPMAVARGDLAPISIGAGSNIQDGAVLHGDPDAPVTIGCDVTIGHRAVVHGATLEDGCLIGSEPSFSTESLWRRRPRVQGCGDPGCSCAQSCCRCASSVGRELDAEATEAQREHARPTQTRSDLGSNAANPNGVTQRSVIGLCTP